MAEQRRKCGVLEMCNKKVFTYAGINLVGRNKEAVVVLRDLIASHYHAIITIINDCHYISDCKSMNGTKVNKVPLVPFQMYPIEDGYEIEFTPKYIGKYTGINKNASQVSMLASSQSASQMTQMEDGFYEQSTQLHKNNTLFKEHLDDEFPRIVDGTQIGDEIPNEILEPIIEEIHEAATQACDLDPICNPAENLKKFNVPTIYEASTQINNITSIVCAFADDFTQTTQPNTQEHDIKSNSDHDGIVCSNDKNHNSSNIEVCAVEESVNSVAASVMDKTVEEALKDGTVEARSPPSSPDMLDTNSIKSNESEKNMMQPEICQSKSSNEIPASDDVINIADLSTQTAKTDVEGQNAKRCEYDTSDSFNLKLSITQDVGAEDDNSMDMLEKLNASDFKMINDFTQNRSLNTFELQKDANEKPNYKDKMDSDIISDSDNEEDLMFKKLSRAKCQSRTSVNRKSRFIVSDSEESENEELKTKKSVGGTSACTTVLLSNDTISESEDSFLPRKSICDVSQYCIPATQDMSVSYAISESFQQNLSVIQEVSTNFQPVFTGGHVNGGMIIDTSKDELCVSVDRLEKQNKTCEIDLQEIDSFENPNETGSVDFLAPTQNIAGPLCIIENNCNDVFLAPTQPVKNLYQTTDINFSGQIHDTQECDFEAATQPPLIKNINADILTNIPSANIETSEDDSEIFHMSTQSVIGFAKSKRDDPRKSKENAKDAPSEDFDFNAPTQNIIVKRDKLKGDHEAQRNDVDAEITQKSNTRSIEEENVDFAVATQVLEGNLDKKHLLGQEQPLVKNDNIKSPNVSAEEDKLNEIDLNAHTQVVSTAIMQCNQLESTESNETVLNFDIPTQMMVSDGNEIKAIEAESESNPKYLAYTEAETAQLLPEPTITKGPPEIESQLEIIFESQNVSVGVTDTARPTNPMANALETSTQDVIDSLLGSGVKRLSDDFKNTSIAKRLKTIRNSKAIISSESCSDTSLKTTENKSDGTWATADNNETPLDIAIKSNPTICTDIKVSSMLSMIKKPNMILVNESNTSNDTIECLADTIPMKVRTVSNNTTNMEESSISNSTFNISAKKAKKRIMDLDSICSMPSPEPTTSREDTDKNDNCIATGLNKSKRCMSDSTKKTSKSGMSPPRRRTKRAAGKRTSLKEQNSKSQKLNSDSALATETKTLRVSSRLKKPVNYSEGNCKSNRKRILECEHDSDSNEEQPIYVDIPDRQVQFIFTDDQSVKHESKKNEWICTDKPKHGRQLKPNVEAEHAVQTPDRAKRISRPKVIFTMLDDPKLQQIIRSLGGTVVDTLEKSNVLVTQKFQRTLKLLAAIAHSIPICSPEWLHKSKQAKTFLNPWDHLIEDPEAEKQWNFRIDVMFKRSKQGKVFAGYHFLVIATLSPDIIKGAIVAHGGKVVARKPAGNFIVVAAPSQKKKYNTFLKNDVKVISSEGIMVAILRQEIVFDNFLLS